MATDAEPGTSRVHGLLGNLVFGTRFATIWIATGVLAIVCSIVAPSTFTSASWSSVLPFGSLVVILALGQMLVIMVGGIDLSMAASISLLANVLVGVSKGADGRLGGAVVAVICVAVLIGFINGVLVAIVELNPLIVTLSMKFVIDGATSQYRTGIANSSTVPDSLSSVVIEKWFGISKAFWAVAVLTLIVSVMLRSSTPGRRFQTVGANRRAAWMAGVHVRTYVILAYIGAAVAAGLGAILLSGLIVSPGPTPGKDYLLGPVAAVVLRRRRTLGRARPARGRPGLQPSSCRSSTRCCASSASTTPGRTSCSAWPSFSGCSSPATASPTSSADCSYTVRRGVQPRLRLSSPNPKPSLDHHPIHRGRANTT